MSFKTAHMWWLKANKHTSFWIVMVVFLCLPSVVGLFHNGFFVSDDGTWMIVRFTAFFEAFRHGQVPVRFLPRLNFGYGYPVADFLYPLFMYLGVPIHLLGFGFVDTIKIIIGLGFILSGVLSFLWLKKIFKPMGALVGAVSYCIFPYHLWDIYKRGSVGEAVAMAIVPFVFWQVETGNFLFTSAGIALLIVAHNTLALFFLPIVFLYEILFKKFSLVKSVLSVFFGLALSAFFWAPALYDQKYTVFNTISVSDFSSYFLTPKNYGLIGYISIAAIFGSFFILRRIQKKEAVFFLIISVLSIFFTLSYSQAIWGIIPFKNLIQFPFRLLAVSALGVAFLIGLVISELSKKYRAIVTLIFLVVLFISSWNFFIPSVYTNFPDSFYSTNVDSTTVRSEYMPVWVKNYPSAIPASPVVIVNGDAKILSILVKGTNIKFTADVVKKSIVQINTVYYPGWNIILDGLPKEIIYNNPTGTMQISLLPGMHLVSAKFQETPIRFFADLISLLSFIFGTIIFLKNKIYAKN